MVSARTIMQRLLKFTNLTPKEFAKKIGYHKPEYINDINKGKTKHISPALIVKIITAFPGVNADWIKTGTGDMLYLGKRKV